MKVLCAEKMGFCFGVEDAVELTENAASHGQPIYSLGPVIHNTQVVDRLARKGVTPVDSLDEVRHGTILIRAHGVGPETTEEIRGRGMDVVDATCVLVRHAQNAVRRLHEEGYQVVMVGDANHPEVRGVVGYAPNVIVVDGEEDLDQLPKRERLGIVAQTTHSPEHVAAVIGRIVARPFREIKIVNTLCLEVVRRQEAAVALCAKVDVVFVLGGLHSANTRELARLCREQGTRTHHIESWESFRQEFVRDRAVAGVTAGASTPPWIIDEFTEKLSAL